jgi:enoyl-CoA hydratase/carnithine racemase
MLAPMKLETVELIVEGPLARMRLARPEHRNALSRIAQTEIAEAAAALDGMNEVRVVVVEGAGPSFSVGADLADLGKLFMSGQSPSHEELLELGELGQRMVESVAEMRAVTIASVRRHAIGGGFLLAAVCDFRVVSDDAVLSLPEVDIGMPLTWSGIPRLIRELGPGWVRNMVMRCEPLPVQVGHALGFIHEVVAAGELDEATDRFARGLLQKPPAALACSKRQMKEASDAWLDASAPRDAALLAESIADPAFPRAAMTYLQRLGRTRGK